MDRKSVVSEYLSTLCSIDPIMCCILCCMKRKEANELMKMTLHFAKDDLRFCLCCKT